MGIYLKNRVMLHAGKSQNKKTKEVEATEMEAVVEGTDEGASLKVTTKRSRAKAESTVPQFGMPPPPSLPCSPCAATIVSKLHLQLTD